MAHPFTLILICKNWGAAPFPLQWEGRVARASNRNYRWRGPFKPVLLEWVFSECRRRPACSDSGNILIQMFAFYE